MPTRKLIEKNEDKISYLQIAGFCFILIGVLLLLLSLTPVYSPKAGSFSTLFFIIMLGVAFAFPELLMDFNSGLSTMRIVVFMVVNVICILLLKTGLAEDITSLKQIGLDQYWMGVIAFVFGAKAAQSFFESKMAIVAAKEKGGNQGNIPEDSYQNTHPAKNVNYVKTPTSGSIVHP